LDEAFFTSEHFESERRFGAFYDNLYFDSLPALFQHLGIIDNYRASHLTVPIPYMSEKKIAGAIQQFLKNAAVYRNSALDDAALQSFLEASHNVQFIFDQDLGQHESSAILGKMRFSPPCIYISKELQDDDCRRRFTLAHEVGHFVLHSPLLKDYLDFSFDCENSLLFGRNHSSVINKQLEIQANIFASQLLLPEHSLRRDLDEYLDQRQICRKGRLYVDSQLHNRERAWSFLSLMNTKYRVSKEAIQYRLENLKLLEFDPNYDRLHRF